MAPRWLVLWIHSWWIIELPIKWLFILHDLVLLIPFVALWRDVTLYPEGDHLPPLLRGMTIPPWDYCNGLLSLPASVLASLQSVQHSSQSDPIKTYVGSCYSLAHTLLWLPMSLQVKARVLTVASKALLCPLSPSLTLLLHLLQFLSPLSLFQPQWPSCCTVNTPCSVSLQCLRTSSSPKK